MFTYKYKFNDVVVVVLWAVAIVIWNMCWHQTDQFDQKSDSVHTQQEAPVEEFENVQNCDTFGLHSDDDGIVYLFLGLYFNHFGSGLVE